MNPIQNADTQSSIRLGIDLGGTKIEIIALDQAGNECLRHRIPTPKDSYAEILNSVCDLVHHAEQSLHITNAPLGIGIPGAISKKTGLIKNANTTTLIGNALDKDLSQKLDRQVRLENDANCFALSEAMDGAGAPYKSIFAVILGTGVGGGLVFNQQLICGPNAITGEWGHNPLPWASHKDLPKQACYCGKKGCIETYLSGPGMANQASLELTHLSPDINSVELLDKQLYGDVYEKYVDRLARSLATVMNIFDPEAIILGGGLSNVETLYEDVPKIWEKFVFSDQVDTPLLKNMFGDSSGVRGAAWLNDI